MAENGYGPVAGHAGRIPNFSRQNAPSQPMCEPPACIQNAMMTKDKKPFTYTPGGLDFAQIKSPSMARRLTRNNEDDYSSQGAATNPPPPPPPQAPAPPPPPPLVIQAPRTKSPRPQPGERPEIIIPDNPIGMLRKTHSPYHWESEKAEREKQGAKYVEKAPSPSLQHNLAPTTFTQSPPSSYSTPQRPNEVNRVPDSPVHRPEPQYISNQVNKPYQEVNRPYQEVHKPNLSPNPQPTWRPVAEPPKPQPQPTFTNQYQNQYQQPNSYNEPNQRQYVASASPQNNQGPNNYPRQAMAPPPVQNNQNSNYQANSRQLMSPPTVQQNQNYQSNARQFMSPPTVQNQQTQNYVANSRQLMSPPTIQNQPPQNYVANSRQLMSPPTVQNNQSQWKPTTPYSNPQIRQETQQYQPQSQTNQQNYNNQNSSQNAWKNSNQQSEEKPYCGIGTNPWKQQDSPQSRQIPVQHVNQNTNRSAEPPKGQSNNHVSWRQPVQETNIIPQNKTSPTGGAPYVNRNVSNSPYNNREADNVQKQNQYQNGNGRNVQAPHNYQNNVTIPVASYSPPATQNQNREIVYVTQEPVYYNNSDRTVPPPFIKQKQRTPPPEWVHIADSRRSIPKDIPTQRGRSPEPEWVSKSNELRRSVPRDLTSPPPQNAQPVWSTKPSDNRKREPEVNVRILPVQTEQQYNPSTRNNYQHQQPQTQMRIVVDTRQPQSRSNEPTELLLSRVTSPHMVRLDDIMPAGKQPSDNFTSGGNCQPKTRIIPIQIESSKNSNARQLYENKCTIEIPRQSKAFRVLQSITGTCDEIEKIFSQSLPYTDF